MEEYKEKHMVKYSCGCEHEIGLGMGGSFWEATGNNTNCNEHK